MKKWRPVEPNLIPVAYAHPDGCTGTVWTHFLQCVIFTFEETVTINFSCIRLGCSWKSKRGFIKLHPLLHQHSDGYKWISIIGQTLPLMEHSTPLRPNHFPSWQRERAGVWALSTHAGCADPGIDQQHLKVFLTDGHFMQMKEALKHHWLQLYISNQQPGTAAPTPLVCSHLAFFHQMTGGQRVSHQERFRWGQGVRVLSP